MKQEEKDLIEDIRWELIGNIINSNPSDEKNKTTNIISFVLIFTAIAIAVAVPFIFPSPYEVKKDKLQAEFFRQNQSILANNLYLASNLYLARVNSSNSTIKFYKNSLDASVGTIAKKDIEYKPVKLYEKSNTRYKIGVFDKDGQEKIIWVKSIFVTLERLNDKDIPASVIYNFEPISDIHGNRKL